MMNGAALGLNCYLESLGHIHLFTQILCLCVCVRANVRARVCTCTRCTIAALLFLPAALGHYANFAVDIFRVSSSSPPVPHSSISLLWLKVD